MKKTALKGEKERLEERYFLGSPDMKVPHDSAGFLCNGSNKEMLFELIQQSIEEKKNLHSDQRTPSDSSSKLQTTKKLTQS